MIAHADLDHVAVAVERQALVWPRYAGELGGRWVSGGGEGGFAAAQVRFRNGMKVEALEPYDVTANDFLRRFLDRNGPGPHHLTFKVADLAGALSEVEAAGYQPVAVDLSNAEWKEAFLHPKDAPGVVIQLAQAAGEWQSPPPAGFPEPAGEPAQLDHVGHAVADAREARRLYQDLLGGRELRSGADEQAEWTLYGWPGPGRVRVLVPRAGSPLSSWLAGRTGAVHHLAFTVARPDRVRGARQVGPHWEVAPEDNYGMRLLLTQG